MAKKIRFDIKEKLVSLTGACFWYWGNLYSFFDSCGVSKSIYTLWPKESHNKYDVMRNIIQYLENKNDTDVINNIISNFYQMDNAVDKDYLDNQKAQRLLKEFRDAVGSDPIQNEIEKQKKNERQASREQELKIKLDYQNNMAKLKSDFLAMYSSADLTPQNRGYKLEELFFELLRLNEFDYTNPYKSDGEQIDGHFVFEKFHYLVELKWTKETIKQKDLSVFDGKIKGKAQSTRGLFLSINGFDNNAILKYSGESPRIILMSGEDLMLILEERLKLDDALKLKVDAIVRHGNIMKALREAL